MKPSSTTHARRSAALAVLLALATLHASSRAAAPPTPPSAAAAIGAALAEAERAPMPGRRVDGETALLRAAYAMRGGPLWTTPRGLTPEGDALMRVLSSADRYGLDPGDYAAGRIASLRETIADDPAAAPSRRTRLDVMLTDAAIRLVTHLHYGRIDPRSAGFALPRRRHALDVAATVAALASAPDVGQALAAVEPQFYHYRLLENALAKYRALAARPDLTRLPPLPRRSLRAGDTYAGAAALRRRLAAIGDLPATQAEAPAGESVLDEPLIAALRRFQERHGLGADGVLGRQTFAALTTPMSHRVEQIELTLERWRWLPPFDAPPIIVNIPQFRLFAFPTVADRTAGMLQMAVIVGQTYPRTRTPVFTGNLQYVVFRPYWDVPRSIVVREMLPEIAAHPGYLARNDLELVRGQSDESPVVPPSPAAIAELAAGRLRLRQRPGDDNALGLVKFIFPNVHDVFMHATPAHHLFAAARRAFSHGCIRVSAPVELARYVLRNGPGQWDDARILAAMHGPDNTRVTLPKPVPVMILYGTALATEAGPVQFFDDVYGQDRRLAALLRRSAPAHAPRSAHPAQSAAIIAAWLGQTRVR